MVYQTIPIELRNNLGKSILCDMQYGVSNLNSTENIIQIKDFFYCNTPIKTNIQNSINANYQTMSIEIKNNDDNLYSMEEYGE